MLFGTKLLALVAAFSTLSFAAPSPNAIPNELEKRNCPRYKHDDFKAAKAIAGLYLGNSNNKSRQVERLFEEVVELLIGSYPKCHAKDIVLVCEDKEYWGWKRDAVPEELEKKWNENPCEDYCEKKYPYKNCHIKCKSKDYC